MHYVKQCAAICSIKIRSRSKVEHTDDAWWENLWSISEKKVFEQTFELQLVLKSYTKKCWAKNALRRYQKKARIKTLIIQFYSSDRLPNLSRVICARVLFVFMGNFWNDTVSKRNNDCRILGTLRAKDKRRKALIHLSQVSTAYCHRLLASRF